MSIDHIILGVISINPCSGYDMKAEFEKGGAGLLSALSFGSIYPRLKQLEEDGLVMMQQESGEGRRRKVYELTAKGWRELMLWLRQPSASPLPTRDELLLKMLFWGAAGGERTDLEAQLRQRHEEALDLLNYLADWQRDGASFVDEYTALVFDYFRSRLEAEAGWIEKTVAQLAEEPQLPPQDPRWLAVLQKARRQNALEPQQDARPEQAEE